MDLSKFAELIKKTAEDNALLLFKAGSADLGREIAKRTPVKTGRATANWRFGVNREVRGTSNDFDKTKTAITTWKHMVSDVEKAKLRDTLILKNKVTSGDEHDEEYIIKLEEGKSPQARNGMFIVSIARSQKIFDKSLKRLKRQGGK